MLFFQSLSIIIIIIPFLYQHSSIILSSYSFSLLLAQPNSLPRFHAYHAGELHTAQQFMCYVTFVNSLPYKAMRRLGKHTTYEFQTHVELDAPSVMCSCLHRGIITLWH